MTTKYDPTPDVDYGICKTCDAAQPTEELARAHMSETGAANTAGRSHTIIIKNPSRKDRIQSAIDDIIEDAISDTSDQFVELTSDGSLSDEEVAEALRRWDDFSDDWADVIADRSR